MLILNIFLIILGMALLVKGGDFLVDGASNLARRFNVSELAIGLTIVAFGTSAPELVVSLSAAIGSHPEIALGNVFGSNNINLMLILGITAVITPLAVQKNTIRYEIPFSLLAAIILFVLANFAFLTGEKNIISRIDGVILLLFFALFVFYVFKSMKNTEISAEKTSVKLFSLGKSILFIVLGFISLILGGRVVVNSAVYIAQALNISEKIIGLTIVAVGTSLPELVTSITAVIKKSEDIAIGNIIGSNIFNIFLILGASSLVRPMEYSPVFNRDIYVLIAGTLFLLLSMFTGKKNRLDRWQGAALALAYVGYVAFMIVKND